MKKLGKQQMMNKFLESAVNDDQSLPYGPNHWTKDDPTEVGSDSRNWRRCDKPQPQPILQPQWQEPPQPTRVTSYPYQGKMNSHPYGKWSWSLPTKSPKGRKQLILWYTSSKLSSHQPQGSPGRDAQSLPW